MALAVPMTVDETGLVPLIARQNEPLEMLRRAAAVHWYGRNEHGMRVLLHYGDCALAQRDPRFVEPGMEMLRARGITEGPLYRWWSSSLFNNETDRHRGLRGVISPAFTPAAIDLLRPTISAMANDLVNNLDRQQPVDLIAELADPLPVRIVAHLAGIDDQHVAQLGRWSDILGRSFVPFDAVDHLRIEQAIVGLYGLVDDLVRTRAEVSGTDLVSHMVAALQNGLLNLDELRAMVATVLVAGHDTTRSALGCLAATLLRHPAIAERLAEDPASRPGIIEELLRFNPPVAGGLRKATEDVILPGGSIGRGEVLLVSGLAANHDPQVFDAPHELRPDRFAPGVTSVARPLTFGLGAHYCLGANLARATLEETLPALFARRIRLATDDLEWRSGGFRCPAQLWVCDNADPSLASPTSRL